jgi:hypothetical protein
LILFVDVSDLDSACLGVLLMELVGGTWHMQSMCIDNDERVETRLKHHQELKK